jgi:alpha-galactosidase
MTNSVNHVRRAASQKTFMNGNSFKLKKTLTVVSVWLLCALANGPAETNHEAGNHALTISPTPATAVASWADLKISGAQIVRDLWRQKDLGGFDKEFSATVAPHGVVLVRIHPAKSQD